MNQNTLTTYVPALNAIKAEVTVDRNGVGYFSQSAVARLCGVESHTINEHLSGNSSKLMQTIDLDSNVPIGKLDDISVMRFIEYYAFESKASNQTAMNNFRGFAAVGLRVLAQEVTGYQDSQFRILDKEHQKLQMSYLKLQFDEKKAYVKANTIANKAVSNLFGFAKMIKKDSMNKQMLSEREGILEDIITLMKVMGIESGSGVKEIIYNKYQQKLLAV